MPNGKQVEVGALEAKRHQNESKNDGADHACKSSSRAGEIDAVSRAGSIDDVRKYLQQGYRYESWENFEGRVLFTCTIVNPAASFDKII